MIHSLDIDIDIRLTNWSRIDGLVMDWQIYIGLVNLHGISKLVLDWHLIDEFVLDWQIDMGLADW